MTGLSSLVDKDMSALNSKTFGAWTLCVSRCLHLQLSVTAEAGFCGVALDIDLDKSMDFLKPAGLLLGPWCA